MSTIAPSQPDKLPLITLPGDEPLYEIIDGQRVEIPHMSAFASILASRLLFELQSFAKTHALGQAVVETLFHLPVPVDRNRRPDLAFVSFERWPMDRPEPLEDNAWDVVPDLAVEVVSPNDDAEQFQEKIDEYFQAGVRLVWVIYPKLRRCHVYDSHSLIRIVNVLDTLEGGDVLPGFRLPLADLFPGKATQV